MNRRIGWPVLLALVLATYAVAGWRAVLAHTDPTEMDTVAYLDAALQIRQTGGILHFLPNLLNGVYQEATQHPLYLLALSPLAGHTIQAFIGAKLVSFAVGFIFLTVFFLAVRRFYGEVTAAVACGLWIASAGFLTLVTTVACEGLLGVFVVAFWWALAEGREKRSGWWWAGLFAGLAFLTKSLGIMLLPVFVVSACWWERKNIGRLLRTPAFWGFFGMFVLTAMPLFVRNALVYGSPLYSDSSGVLWIDRWDEFSYERAAEGRFTLAHYLATHSAADIVRIFWEGLWKRDVLMVVDGLKPLPFWRSIPSSMLSGFYHRTAAWQEGWAALVVLLAAVGWWMRRRIAPAAPTLVMGMVFAFFVGWYSKVFPQTPPTRLLYPVLIFFPVYAAVGCRELAHRFGLLTPRGGSFLRACYEDAGKKIAAVGLSLVITGVWISGAGAWKDVRKSFEFPAIFRIQMAWANASARPGDKILVGQQFASLLFYFEPKSMKLEFVSWPKVDGMDQLVEWVLENRVRYAFVDLATALYNPQVFADYYRVQYPGTLKQLRPLPDVFQPIPKDPRIPNIFDIYAVSAPERPVS